VAVAEEVIERRRHKVWKRRRKVQVSYAVVARYMPALGVPESTACRRRSGVVERCNTGGCVYALAGVRQVRRDSSSSAGAGQERVACALARVRAKSS